MFPLFFPYRKHKKTLNFHRFWLYGFKNLVMFWWNGINDAIFTKRPNFLLNCRVFLAILAGKFWKELATLVGVPSPVKVPHSLSYTDDASMTPKDLDMEFLVPDWGEEVGYVDELTYQPASGCGDELLHRPASLCSLACRYDNSMPSPVSSPLSWTKITASGGD